ncbi:MAG TPA: hypothetical protein VNY73_07955 [Bacteroidia bacterium]|nr:hypothetical protein [Bacteroidia bacterium]
MKTLFKCPLIAAACLFLSSCASYNVSYLKSTAQQPKVNKLYILVNDSLTSMRLGMNGSDQNAFMKALSQSISNCLTQCGVKNTLKVASSVYTLDSKEDINLQIKSSGADALVNIKREQSTVMSGKYGSSYNGGVYTITVSSINDNKPYWKAVIESTGEIYSQESDYTSLAKQVVDKLKADGII